MLAPPSQCERDDIVDMPVLPDETDIGFLDDPVDDGIGIMAVYVCQNRQIVNYVAKRRYPNN